MKLTKKLLPLAGIACVTAAAVPAIASCSCGNKDETTVTLAEKDVYGTLHVVANNKKAMAVYTFTLDKELPEGEDLTAKIDIFTSDTMDKDGDASTSVDPTDAKIWYVMVPVKTKKASDADLVAKDKAEMTLKISSKKTIKEFTTEKLTYTMADQACDVCAEDFTIGGYANLTSTVEIASTKTDCVVEGLSLISERNPSTGVPTKRRTFDGKIYICSVITATEDTTAAKKAILKNELYDEVKIYKPEGAQETDPAYGLAFNAKSDTDLSAGETDFIWKAKDAGETVTFLFVPKSAKTSPFYTEVQFDGDTTTGLQGIEISVAAA